MVLQHDFPGDIAAHVSPGMDDSVVSTSLIVWFVLLWLGVRKFGSQTCAMEPGQHALGATQQHRGQSASESVGWCTMLRRYDGTKTYNISQCCACEGDNQPHIRTRPTQQVHVKEVTLTGAFPLKSLQKIVCGQLVCEAWERSHTFIRAKLCIRIHTSTTIYAHVQAILSAKN